MTWSDESPRHSELPPDWAKIREKVLERDHYTCRDCGKPANQVDHKRRGNDHSLGNLQALCRICHAVKSSQEGHAARWGKK